ncbi:hypothetical protein LPB140_09020 [Sphingorhabdus lutea]|uniref:Uncharacterized protein n=1 Tax=Sphingorhabdus lutea TaxID=1913578 RepID=A0A1L3JCM5_9SPHN|nr:hypothetical protein [Sphingorhabdus lutea]APG62907.1 hypothetical protein LPB140_09020 [Sphingorhabdus lutea]
MFREYIFSASSALALSFASLLPIQAKACGDDAPMRDVNVDVAQTSYRVINFVPKGWKLYDKVDGDLNGDGRNDSALVIQKNDPIGMVQNPDGLGSDEYDANPRILIIVFADEKGGYRRVGMNDVIIPDHDSPTISDPYADMSIANGKLFLRLEFFASAGSWTMFNKEFNLRWDGANMNLIGYDMHMVHRASGAVADVSANFLTGKIIISEGNIENEAEKSKVRQMKKPHKYRLEDIENGFQFEPDSNLYSL